MYYLYLLGKILANFFSRNIGYNIAEILALLKYYISKKEVAAVKYNILPFIKNDEELVNKSKQVFVNFAYYLMDFFRYDQLNKKFIEKYVRVTGLNYLDKALSEKKGVILLSAHLGNYELGGAVVSSLGYETFVVALSHKEKKVKDFFDKQRKKVGLNVIPIGTSIRRCISALKKNGVIAFVGDRDFSGTAVEVKMGNLKAQIPQGFSYFALKTGCAIVPTFFVRENKKFYNLIFDKPIEYEKTDSQILIINKYTNILIEYLQKYYDQWYLFQKYWS